MPKLQDSSKQQDVSCNWELCYLHLIDHIRISSLTSNLWLPSNTCVNCKLLFGEYHCEICNLWMSSSEQPYHCKECGFCRVGGKNNFKHCKGCGMCIDANLFNNHNCKSGKYMANCPVCYEDLFSSRSATHVRLVFHIRSVSLS